MSWKRTLGRIAAEVEERVDSVRRPMDRRLRPNRPVRIVPYRGYGTPDGVRIRGRVLHGRAPGPASPDDGWWRNLAAAYRRIESDEVAHARVRARFAGQVAEAVADDEGHFQLLLSPADAPGDRYWHHAHIELVQPNGQGAEAAVAIPRSPRFGVISDLDDTVLKTDVRNVLRMAREVLFGNAHTRVPFAGVGAFYRALHDAHGAGNPVFYVSSSPWNLHDLLDEFLRLHRIPPGPMHLRDWGITRDEVLPTGHHGHKRAAIDQILATYPDLPFILVGDSGQEDPEIYRQVVHDLPRRVLAVYIRNVVPDPARIGAIRNLANEISDTHGDCELVLVDDTISAARHAAERGWIDDGAIPDIARDRAVENAADSTPV
jgi:phosphatidate phosphatase APP1